MNAKISVFIIYVETIIYLLLYNLHDCTFKEIFNVTKNDVISYAFDFQLNMSSVDIIYQSIKWIVLALTIKKHCSSLSS